MPTSRWESSLCLPGGLVRFIHNKMDAEDRMVAGRHPAGYEISVIWPRRYHSTIPYEGGKGHLDRFAFRQVAPCDKDVSLLILQERTGGQKTEAIKRAISQVYRGVRRLIEAWAGHIVRINPLFPGRALIRP